MRICSGATRHVLIVGNVAIKFARTGLSRPFTHLYWLLFKTRLARAKYNARYVRPTLIRSLGAYVRRHTLGGFKANRQEYRLYIDHPELPLARVRGIYLWGFILVMDAGDPLPTELISPLIAQYPAGDLDKSWHICLFNGKPLYIDYGHPDALSVFGLT